MAILKLLHFVLLILISCSVRAIEIDPIFYSLPSQTQGHFLTVKKIFPHEKGGIWVQDIRHHIYYFDGQNFSPLPNQGFHHDSPHNTYLLDYFWFIDSKHLLKVDTSGNRQSVFTAPSNMTFQHLGQSQQQLWIYGQHQFYTFDPLTQQHQSYSVSNITRGSTQDNQGIQAAIYVAGKWIVATHDSLFYLDKNGPRRLLARKFTNIQLLKFDHYQSRLLVGTQSGLFSINLIGITPDVKTIVDGQIQALLVSDKDYWVGTRQGLLVYQKDTQTIQSISASSQNELALSNNNIMDLAQDNKGGVWIATAKGINYYSTSSQYFQRVRFGRAHNNIPYVHINEVVAGDDGVAWLASDNGVFKVSVNDDEASTQTVRQVVNLNISHLSYFDGSLWLSYGEKLIRFDTHTEKMYVVRQQALWQDSPITHIATDAQGEVWFSTALGLYRYSPLTQTIKDFGLAWMVEQYAPSNITRLAVGQNGRLWIGTEHGVYQHQGQEIIFDARSANDGEVISLSESAGKQLWSASHYGLRNMPVSDFDETDSLLHRSNNPPLCVIGTHNGTWVTTSKGINFYQDTVLKQRFSAPFGLVTNEFLPNGCDLSPDGKTLVLSSKLGVIFASTSALKQVQLPENDVLVGELQLDHSLAMVAPQTNTPIHIDYGRSISVLFGVLPDFEMPKLQYRLLGSDKDTWVDFQGAKLTFENLDPGEYLLELKTASQVGARTSGVQYILVIDKPWYLLPWSLTLFAFVIITSIILLAVWRSQAMVKSNVRLRRIINLKTQQLKHQSQLLVSSNIQLRKQAQTRKMLVGDRVCKSKAILEKLNEQLTETDNQDSDKVSMITQQTGLALEPLRQILALYSHPDKSSTLLDGQVVSLVLKTVVKGWQQEADKSGITLLVEDQTQGCVIQVKHFNLDMILNTLMASALIRSSANQIIYVAAKLTESQHLRITIEDTGEGVAEDEILAFEKQEYGLVDAEYPYSFSDTSLCAIAHMAEQSGGDFDFHYNQLSHITQLAISWPVATSLSPVTESSFTKDNQDEPASESHSPDSLQEALPEATLIKNEWLDKVYQLVEQHYPDADFSTCRAAKLLFVSERSLQRKFKSLTGGSFMDYVTKVRLEKACELLISGVKISDTAFETGFNDPSYFSQRFKHYFGLSPSKFIENAID